MGDFVPNEHGRCTVANEKQSDDRRRLGWVRDRWGGRSGVWAPVDVVAGMEAEAEHWRAENEALCAQLAHLQSDAGPDSDADVIVKLRAKVEAAERVVSAQASELKAMRDGKPAPRVCAWCLGEMGEGDEATVDHMLACENSPLAAAMARAEAAERERDEVRGVPAHCLAGDDVALQEMHDEGGLAKVYNCGYWSALVDMEQGESTAGEVYRETCKAHHEAQASAEALEAERDELARLAATLVDAICERRQNGEQYGPSITATTDAIADHPAVRAAMENDDEHHCGYGPEALDGYDDTPAAREAREENDDG